MVKTYQRDGSINILIFQNLAEIFRELNWEIENQDRFFQFCKLLTRLNHEEQQLMLELTRNFLHCGFIHYETTLRRIVPKLEESIPEHVEEIIIAPLISPRDVGRSKSSSLLVYPLQELLRPLARKKRIKLSNIDRCSELQKRNTRKNTLVVFVDDFLGSGQTAQEALKVFNANFKVASDTVIVIALVAQKIATTVLAELQVKVFCAHLRDRGITDSTRISDKASALKLIDQIESRMKVKKDFRRGYQQSEALVCMLRCPNNTFPVFWLGKKVNGEPWPAPFPR